VDLDLLRELLDSSGCFDILSPKANCIPMIQHFQAGMPHNPKTGKTFTAKLVLLSPILFAGHKLVGKSHKATARHPDASTAGTAPDAAPKASTRQRFARISIDNTRVCQI